MAVLREGSIHRYVGLSTDVKPTGGVPAGSLFMETDTGRQYKFDGTATWGATAPLVAHSGIEAPSAGATQGARSGLLDNAVYRFTGGEVAGEMPCVVIEAPRGSPGILTSLWCAISGPSVISVEGSSQVRIFIDDDTTPVVDVPLNDFFMYAYQGGTFSTPRVGRTHRGNYGGADFTTSAFRMLWMPFDEYCRVEIINGAAADGSLWAQANFQPLDAPYVDAQRRFHIYPIFEAAHAAQTPVTIVDQQGVGPGQIESIAVAVRDPSDNSWLEGNVDIYIDGETHPRWASSGGEDFALGGFYDRMIGGYPAGRPGDPITGGDGSFYRFFPTEPIVFKTGIKIVWNVGQQAQGALNGVVGISGSVGLWLQTPGAISYKNRAAVPEFLDTFTEGDGALPAPYVVNGVGSTIVVSANRAVMTDAAATDRFAIRPVVAADYFVSVRTRITNAGVDAEAFLKARMVVGGGVGDGVSLELKRHAQYDWQILARDAFANPHTTSISDNVDLINTDIDLGLECVGTKVSAYWKFAADTVWRAIGSWTTAHVGGYVGVGTWIAAAQFDNLEVQAVA